MDVPCLCDCLHSTGGAHLQDFSWTSGICPVYSFPLLIFNLYPSAEIKWNCKYKSLSESYESF